MDKIFIKILYWTAIGWNYSLLIINEEYIIGISLIIFFYFLFYNLKNKCIQFFLKKIEYIYFHFLFLIILELKLLEQILIFLKIKEIKFVPLSLIELYANFTIKLNYIIKNLILSHIIWYKITSLYFFANIKNYYNINNYFIKNIKNKKNYIILNFIKNLILI